MINSSISNKQKKILLFVKYYVKNSQHKVNVANSAICYFHNYGNFISSSYLKLKFYGIKYFAKFTKNLIQNFYSVIKTENYICIKKNTSKVFKNLIISHVSKDDFLKDGSYFDKYFSLNSKKFKNSLFFLNSIDGFCPKNLSSNLIVYKKEKSNLSYLGLIINFFRYLFTKNFSLRSTLHEFNFLSQFSLKIFPHLMKTVYDNNFKKIILFYESQPYQNNFINELKKKKNKVKTIGFYHSGLLPLHTSLVFREGAPDKLLISGGFQKKYCEKYLGWPKNRVFNVSSFRYSKKSVINQKNVIFLPYAISRSDTILNSLEVLFKKSKKKTLPILSIKNHPATLNSKKHLLLIKNIKDIIKRNKEKFSNRSKNVSIFIGSTTSIILALEQKKEVIHICEDPIFDSFNSKIWKNLVITRLDNFVFKYRLKQNKRILNIQKNNKNKIRQYL